MDKDEIGEIGETFIQSFQQNSNGVAVRYVLPGECVNNIIFFGASTERSFK
jgi:hypothetical protein